MIIQNQPISTLWLALMAALLSPRMGFSALWRQVFLSPREAPNESWKNEGLEDWSIQNMGFIYILDHSFSCFCKCCLQLGVRQQQWSKQHTNDGWNMVTNRWPKNYGDHRCLLWWTSQSITWTDHHWHQPTCQWASLSNGRINRHRWMPVPVLSLRSRL